MATQDYFFSVFQRWLDFTFWIRRSGQLCVDLIPSNRRYWSYNLPPISHRQKMKPLDAPDQEAMAIDALTLEQYHQICYWNLSQFQHLYGSASATVNLNSIIVCRSGIDSKTRLRLHSCQMQGLIWIIGELLKEQLEKSWKVAGPVSPLVIYLAALSASTSGTRRPILVITQSNRKLTFDSGNLENILVKTTCKCSLGYMADLQSESGFENRQYELDKWINLLRAICIRWPKTREQHSQCG
ncbi:hypothetical protein B0H13DRAFT_92665 [Mycena leptocephala]|nr:hypothetical protein B0H13DRAFT_92665 [Mycena leptocephala]